jgi:hypothetical protein
MSFLLHTVCGGIDYEITDLKSPVFVGLLTA